MVDQANLRIDVRKFTHYLLIDQKLRVGRLDGRFTGPDPNGSAGYSVLRSDGISHDSAVYFGLQ